MSILLPALPHHRGRAVQEAVVDGSKFRAVTSIDSAVAAARR
jgi:hypothetical protein